MIPPQAQVLIVGAGPTGLSLALTLSKNGIPVRVIDKASTPHCMSRGAGFHPRTQEIAHFLGTLPNLLSYKGSPPFILRYDLADPTKLLKSESMVEIVEPTPDCPITAPINVGQYIHERVLREYLAALGCEVEFSTKLVDVKQDEQEVTVELEKRADGKTVRETVMFPFVVGADGGHSTVRKAIGVNFIGETQKLDQLLVGDVEVEGMEGKGFGVHTFGDDTKIITILRNTNEPRRFQHFILGPKFHEIANECAGATIEQLQTVFNRVSGRTDLKFKKIYAISNWTYNQRMIDHFKVGRVFVAGDAAHAHTPMGGQGMNSGVQDSFNLAWKLALVIKSYAPLSLLDSYEEERLPVIADMLLETARLHRMMYHPEREGENKQHDVKNVINSLENAATPVNTGSVISARSSSSIRPARGRKLFQLDVNYRWSSIVLDERYASAAGGGTAEERDAYGQAGHDLRAGDRAPDAPGLAICSTASSKAIGKLTGTEAAGDVVRLFDILSPDKHITLVFSSSADFVRGIQEALATVPAGLAASLVILPQGQQGLEGSPSVDLVLEDREGHAFRGYKLDTKENIAVIVRPDAMIGCFATTRDGVQAYFSKTLNSG